MRLKEIHPFDIFKIDMEIEVFASWRNKQGIRVFNRMRDLRLDVIYQLQADVSTIWFTVDESKPIDIEF